MLLDIQDRNPSTCGESGDRKRDNPELQDGAIMGKREAPSLTRAAHRQSHDRCQEAENYPGQAETKSLGCCAQARNAERSGNVL